MFEYMLQHVDSLETRESKKKEQLDISCTHLIKARWQANGSAMNAVVGT